MPQAFRSRRACGRGRTLEKLLRKTGKPRLRGVVDVQHVRVPVAGEIAFDRPPVRRIVVNVEQIVDQLGGRTRPRQRSPALNRALSMQRGERREKAGNDRPLQEPIGDMQRSPRMWPLVRGLTARAS